MNRHIQIKDQHDLQAGHKIHVSMNNSCVIVSTMVLVDIIITKAYAVCSSQNKNGLKQHPEEKLSWIVMET